MPLGNTGLHTVSSDDRGARQTIAERSIDPAFYRDHTVMTQEIEKIFRKSWIGIGRADRLKAAGDYATIDVAGQSIIITKDRDGEPRAFANTCRHRGARLIDGEGNCRGFQCPFHAWSYRLDGSLRSAPKMAEVAGFSKEENGLVSYRIEEHSGFAFLCLNSDVKPLDKQLGNFGDLHAPWPLESLVSFRRRVFNAPCNWKAFLEVFNEYYHLPCVHPQSINALYQPPHAPDHATGAFASQFGPTSGTGALLQDEQESALPAMPGLSPPWVDGARYSWAFPNMTFAAGRDALWVYEAYPVSAEECHVVQTICFPPETIAHPHFDARSKAYVDRLDAALEEDLPALENQMKGLRNPDARAGLFQTNLEPNVAAFATWYREMMTS